MLNLESWTIDLVQVNAKESFTSYAGLEMRLIIHKFSRFSEGRVDLPNKYTQNLFRDPVACTCINNFVENQQKIFLAQAIKKHKPADLSKLLPKEADFKMIKVKTETGFAKQNTENTISIDGA